MSVDKGRVVNDTSEELTGNLYEEEGTQENQIITEQEKPQYEIPSKFKDKGLEDVVKSYSELEKSFGKQAQELGDARKLADRLVQRELDSKTVAPAPQVDNTVEFDYDNPIESINKLVEQKLRPVSDKLTKTDAYQAQQELSSKHPDYQSLVQSDEFNEWVNSSNVRVDLYSRANNNLDIEAASELLDTFKALHPQAKETSKEDKAGKIQERVADMSTESGSSGQVSTKIFKRKEIINLRTNNPTKYWEMADEIRQAYADGRVR
jgi:hypothetical protein